MSDQPQPQAPLWPALLATLVAAAAVGAALRPALANSWMMWAVLCLPYAALAAWALRLLRTSGRLGQVLGLRFGDASKGILLGLAMTAAGLWAVAGMLPSDSAATAWLFRIYAQVGDVQNTASSIAVLLCMAFMEEVVWRSLVLDTLAQRWGLRAALPLSAVLYAAAHLPTMLTLGDPDAGPNPLLVLAALGAGLCWAFAYRLLGRLPPVILAHAVFAYFMAAPSPSWLGF